MAAITTTGTLTAGNSRTFALAPGSALTLTLLPNCRVTVTETPETVSASDAGGNSPRTHNHQFAGVFTYGPYVMGGSVVVDNASNSGSTVTWGRKDTTVSTSSDGLSLVSGDEIVDVWSGTTTTQIQNALLNTLAPYSTLPKVAAKVVPQLTPVDWYPDAILCSDGTYLYGSLSSSTDTVVRYPLGSHVATTGAQCAAGLAITFIEPTSTPGLIFIHVQTAAGSGDIYRSTDYGATATKVLELGSRNQAAPVSGARSPNVRWLSGRSFCEATIQGRQVLFIGEYNIGTTRTIGGANDAVCLYESTDAGVTWSIVAEWNTDGDTSYNDGANFGNYIRHIHAVRYSPVDGNVYILCGDVGTVSGVDNNFQAGFIQWDGVTPITSNALLSSYDTTGLRNLSGSQMYRMTDMLFEDDAIYCMTDAINTLTSVEWASGMFTFPYDLSTPERKNKSILEVPNRSGRLGLKHPNGNHLWIDAVEGANTTAGQYFNSVYTSSSDRSTMARNAVCRCKTGGVSWNPFSFFVAGTRIYVTNTAGGGIGKSGTSVVEFDASLPWNGERPDTIAPVYFVDTVNGTDDATTTSRILRGNAPGTDAFKTLQYAMTGSRVPHGGRIHLTAGTYSESTSINPVFLTTDADTTEYVNVSGAGKDLTVVGNNSSASNWLFGPVSGSVIQNWDFQDLRLTTFKGGAQQVILLFTSYAYTGEFYTRLIRAEIGKRRGDVSAVAATDDSHNHIPVNIAHTSVALRPNFRLVDSGWVYKNASDISNSAVLLFHNGAAGLPVADISALRSYFWGGVVQHGGAAATFVHTNCIFGGSSNSKGNINLLASATVAPRGYRPRFESQAAAKQIVNDSTLPVVGAGQMVDAVCNQPLDAAVWFDGESRVEPGGRVKSPYTNDYSIIPVY